MQCGLLDEIKELNKYNFAQQSKKQTSAPDQADQFCIFENDGEPQINAPENENPDNVQLIEVIGDDDEEKDLFTEPLKFSKVFFADFESFTIDSNKRNQPHEAFLLCYNYYDP